MSRLLNNVLRKGIKARKQSHAKRKTERARLLAYLRNAAAPPDERVPVRYLRFMLECGLLVQGHGTLTGCRVVDCHDDANIDVDETQPWALMFDIQGPGKDMSMLLVAIGDKRIDDAMSTAASFPMKMAVVSRVTRALCLWVAAMTPSRN